MKRMTSGPPAVLEAELGPPVTCLAAESQSSVADPVSPYAALAISEPLDSQPDAWLVAAIRRDPPDVAALDELAQRHWKTLFAHCQMIALNRSDAGDLAQEAWCRILRSRHNLKPEGNFPAYLHTIAMNLWRDRCRSESRAGCLAASRIVSLEACMSDQDGDAITLADAVPDLSSLEAQQQARLMTDIDQAMGRLTPLLRGVLVARFLMGESCAEIGRRHGRTEQTVSGWVRQGVGELRKHLLELRGDLSREGTS